MQDIKIEVLISGATEKNENKKKNNNNLSPTD